MAFIKGFRMKTEPKAAWIAALRGGLFEQGKYKLCSVSQRYCCMGVFAKIMGVKDWKPIGGSDADGLTFKFNEDRSSIASLPGEWFKDYFEVSAPALEFQAESYCERLTCILQAMNDREGKSFAQIADWIEENL